MQKMAAEMEFQSRLEQQQKDGVQDKKGQHREGIVSIVGENGEMPRVVTEMDIPPFQNLKERFEAEEARIHLSHQCAENWKYQPSAMAMRVVARLPGGQQVR